jgi:hypothetical protein
MIMKLVKLCFFTAILLGGSPVFSQVKNKDIDITGKWSVVSGLIQPIAFGGVNIATTYHGHRWTFEYSHGMFLHYPKIVRRDKGLVSLYSVYSTGPGVGYRINNVVDVRFEVKMHQYKAGLNNLQSITYTNVDAGFGLYSRKYIFRNKQNGWRPFFLEHSFRYWQNFHSTLDNRKYSYTDKDGNNRVHKPHNIGFFYNLSVGYTLGMKKNKNHE